MRIPRCRATVSEEIAAGHWGNLGRPAVVSGRAQHVLTREPGDRREPSTPNPFACKGEVMRSLRLFSCLLFLVAVACAEIKIRVVDPRSVAVSGAQVVLLNQDAVISTQTTASDGAVVFESDRSASRVRVLAAGFTPGGSRPGAVSESGHHGAAEGRACRRDRRGNSHAQPGSN